jgi:hypothetical protein
LRWLTGANRGLSKKGNFGKKDNVGNDHRRVRFGRRRRGPGRP